MISLMNFGPRILLLLPLIGTIACGSSPSTTVTSRLSGNWNVSGTYNFGSSISEPPVIGFNGALQFSNGLVTETGSLTLFFSSNSTTNCTYGNAIDNSLPIAKGTLDTNNNLTLSFPISGGTATYTATLGSNPKTLTDGSFQIIGGACAMSATPMTIAQYAPLTGTYIGTLNYSSNGNITVTAYLTQSTNADANGHYPITGTVNVTGTCTNSTTFSGYVAGNSITNINAPIAFSFFGNFDPSATTINPLYYTSVNCAEESQGTITRQ